MTINTEITELTEKSIVAVKKESVIDFGWNQ